MSRRSAGSIRSCSSYRTRTERRSRSKRRITLANQSETGASLPVQDRGSILDGSCVPRGKPV